VFKLKFNNWDDVIAVDFTRTADSVAKTGANLHEWMSKQEVKIDTSALFLPRARPMSSEEEDKLIENWNEDLKSMGAFVLEGKKFTRLPEEEIGHFYSEDCYVFLCKYLVPLEIDEDEDEEALKDEEEVLEDFQIISYFWQGRDASNMGWLTFTFDMLKTYQRHFGNIEVIKNQQQQENFKFLSHFNRKFIIHHGKRKTKNQEDNIPKKKTEFFYLRSNGSKITTRCIEINPDSAVLNSGFCFILSHRDDEQAKDNENAANTWIWIGSKAAEEEAELAQEIALQMYSNKGFNIQLINEHEEPSQFWQALGGRKAYEKDHSFMLYSRLFRCSNDKGYFSISEKCTDFCQDDLADEDIMILDNGDQVFVWVGSRCSDVEIKLALKSAQVYVQNMRIKQPDRPRQMMLTFKGKESKRFSKCFHGWMKHRALADPRIKYLATKELQNGDA